MIRSVQRELEKFKSHHFEKLLGVLKDRDSLGDGMLMFDLPVQGLCVE